MGLKYLDGKSWSEVTRDERYFCQRLFSLIQRSGLPRFIDYLNSKLQIQVDPGVNWEVAYEVCFYRDLWQHRGRKGELFSPKRTFDLALFSDGAIVVIEAKAQQAFEEDQLRAFKQDIAQVAVETGVDNVLLSALASSQCDLTDEIRAYFNGPCLTWKEMAALFADDPVLLRADAVYEEGATGPWGKNNAGGHMTGEELLAAHARRENFFIGRRWGLHGEPLKQDLESGRWRTQKYETNKTAEAPPNANWFRLSEFVCRIQSAPRHGG